MSLDDFFLLIVQHALVKKLLEGCDAVNTLQFVLYILVFRQDFHPFFLPMNFPQVGHLELLPDFPEPTTDLLEALEIVVLVTTTVCLAIQTPLYSLYVADSPD